MKKHLLWLGSAASVALMLGMNLSSCSKKKTRGNSTVSTAPLLHLKFDGNLNNSGTLKVNISNNGSLGYVSGVNNESGTAYECKGSNWISLTDADGLKNDKYTLSVWAYITQEPTGAATAIDLDGQGINWAVNSSTGYSSPGGWATLFYHSPSTSMAYTQGRSYSKMNEWQHIVVSADGQYHRFFIDGKLVDEREYTGSRPTYGANLFNIGGRQNSIQFFTGKLDNIRVYNYALSQAEITSLYNNKE